MYRKLAVMTLTPMTKGKTKIIMYNGVVGTKIFLK